MTPLLWGIALLTLAMSIIVVELFVPSAGVLAALAAVSAVVAIVIVFVYEGLLTGSIFFLVSCILLGITVASAIRWWPHTAIGRKVLNLPPGEEEAIASPPDYGRLQQLVGQYGMSASKMVPGGVITVAGKSYDAISQAGVIDEGTPVVVISADGTRIVVRKDTRVQAMEARSSDTFSLPSPARPRSPEPMDSGKGRASAKERDALVDREESDFDEESGGKMPPAQTDDDGPQVIPNPFEDPLV